MKLKHFDIFFEPRDIWIGVYWTHDRVYGMLRVYVCLLPMLPMLLTWETEDNG